MPNAGQIIKALDRVSAVSSTQNTDGTTTSTSFTATLTGGTACSVVFTAPTSGTVLIINVCEAVNSSTSTSICGFRVGTGGVVGSGTEVLAASDLRSVRVQGTSLVRAGVQHVLSGLTPGNSYNVEQQFRVTANTGTFRNKHLAVLSLP